MDKPIPEAVRAQAAAWFAEYDKRNHFPEMLALDAYAAGHAAAQQQGQAVALDRMAIRLLVAAGYVTEAKANEALNIAHGFDKGPLTPPSAPAPVAGDAVAMQPVAEIAMSDDGYKIGLLGPLRAHRLPLGTKLYASSEAALAQDRASQAAAPSAPVGVDGLLDCLPLEVRAANGYDAAWAAGFNEGVLQSRQNLQRALTPQPTPVAPVGVEAYLVERLTGTGYGRARSIVDAAIYNPTEPAFWIDPEAQARHRVTPLVSALAQQPAATQDDIDDDTSCAPGNASWQEGFNAGMEVGRKEAASEKQPAAVDGAMVERACKAAIAHFWPGDYDDMDDLRAMMQSALTAALAPFTAAQQEGAP